MTYQEIYNLALNAGFSGASANTITAIALAESGGNPAAYNPNDPGGSYGLTQINGASHPNAAAAFDPQNALDQAFAISSGGTNFTPWSTYANNAYQKFLQAAESGGGSGAGTSTLSFAPSEPGDPGAGTGGGGGAASTIGEGVAQQIGAGGGVIGGGTIAAPAAGGSHGWLADIVGTEYGLFQRFGIIIAAIVLMGLGAYALLHQTTIVNAAKSTVKGT